MKTKIDSTSDKTRALSEEELRNISGGFIWVPILGGLTIRAVAELVIEWDNFKNGLAGRPETIR